MRWYNYKEKTNIISLSLAYLLKILNIYSKVVSDHLRIIIQLHGMVKNGMVKKNIE